MRVLFVIKGNEPYISQQAQIELAVGLQKKGVNILLTGNFSKEVEVHLNNHSLAYKNVFPRKSVDRQYTKDFEQLIKEHQIELVHFVDGKSARNGLPVIKKSNVKSVIYFGSTSLHWYDPTSYFTYLSPHLDTIIANSDYVYHHVKAQLFKNQEERVARIFKGYNPDWFSDVQAKDLSEFGIPKDAITVCLVGNHRKIKGTKYFLQASHFIKSDRNVHFILIGDQTDSETFQRIKEKSPMKDRIHLMGHRSDIIPILKSIDVYTQTSLDEGFGRAISEAMSLEKPIVMTDAGGCTELIDKDSGIVVPKKDAKAIGQAISKLVNDDDLRHQMGINAKKRIASVYHIDKTIDDTLKLYQRLLNQ